MRTTRALGYAQRAQQCGSVNVSLAIHIIRSRSLDVPLRLFSLRVRSTGIRPAATATRVLQRRWCARSTAATTTSSGSRCTRLPRSCSRTSIDSSRRRRRDRRRHLRLELELRRRLRCQRRISSERCRDFCCVDHDSADSAAAPFHGAMRADRRGLILVFHRCGLSRGQTGCTALRLGSRTAGLFGDYLQPMAWEWHACIASRTLAHASTPLRSARRLKNELQSSQRRPAQTRSASAQPT